MLSHLKDNRSRYKSPITKLQPIHKKEGGIEVLDSFHFGNKKKKYLFVRNVTNLKENDDHTITWDEIF